MIARDSAREALLKSAFAAAVAAASPHLIVVQSQMLSRLSNDPPPGRAIVLALGKAASGMATALVEGWPLPDAPSGLVICPDGLPPGPAGLRTLYASHPRADARSANAAESMLSLVGGLRPLDRLLVMLSGGGSALSTLPVDGLSLQDLVGAIELLMQAGANIDEINIVRKHLGRVGGGKLCHASGTADIDVLALSDVAGDDIATIASGPFSAGTATRGEAAQIFARYGVLPNAWIAAALADPASAPVPPNDPCFAAVRTETVSADIWIDDAITMLTTAGYRPELLGRQIDGDARMIARDHASAALDRAGSTERVALISGGEATVQVRGTGYGGPAAETALVFAEAVNGHPAISALFADTDGIDGPTANAGAIVGPDTLSRIAGVGLSTVAALASSDSASLFDALGDSLRTGPTGTNVNDFRVILINQA